MNSTQIEAIRGSVSVPALELCLSIASTVPCAVQYYVHCSSSGAKNP